MTPGPHAFRCYRPERILGTDFENVALLLPGKSIDMEPNGHYNPRALAEFLTHAEFNRCPIVLLAHNDGAHIHSANVGQLRVLAKNRRMLKREIENRNPNLLFGEYGSANTNNADDEQQQPKLTAWREMFDEGCYDIACPVLKYGPPGRDKYLSIPERTVEYALTVWKHVYLCTYHRRHYSAGRYAFDRVSHRPWGAWRKWLSVVAKAGASHVIDMCCYDFGRMNDIRYAGKFPDGVSELTREHQKYMQIADRTVRRNAA